MINVSFRITLPELSEDKLVETIADHYALHVKHYLVRKFNATIRYSTMGLHRNAAYPHFHYHLVCDDFKIPSNPNQSWKYYWTEQLERPFLQNSPYHTHMVHKLKGLKKINISIKYTETEKALEGEEFHHGTKKYLGYPLKEGISLDKYCINIDIKPLKEFATLLYEEAKARNAVKLANKEEKISKYEAYCSHMDIVISNHYLLNEEGEFFRLRISRLEPNDYVRIVAEATHAYYFKLISKLGAKEHIHPKQITYNMEKYNFANGQYPLRFI